MKKVLFLFIILALLFPTITLADTEVFRGSLNSRVIYRNDTAVGTDANLLEKTLMQYTLPAGVLNPNVKGLRITVYYSTAANANNKSMKVYFGSTAIQTAGPLSLNNTIQLDFLNVERVTSSSQKAFSFGWVGNIAGNPGAAITYPAENENGTILIKATGQNGTAAANDVVCHMLLIELIP